MSGDSRPRQLLHDKPPPGVAVRHERHPLRPATPAAAPGRPGAIRPRIASPVEIHVIEGQSHSVLIDATRTGTTTSRALGHPWGTGPPPRDDQEAAADAEQTGEEPDGEPGADGFVQAAAPVDSAAGQGAVPPIGTCSPSMRIPAATISAANPISTTQDSSSRLTAAPANAAPASRTPQPRSPGLITFVTWLVLGRLGVRQVHRVAVEWRFITIGARDSAEGYGSAEDPPR